MRQGPKPKKSVLLVLACAFLAAGAVCGSVWWLDFSEEPLKSDAIVLLGSADYGRPVYAAELWRKGFAPEVWLSRQAVRPSVVLARRLGVAMPTEEEAFRAILLHEGVPKDRIRPYGWQVVSTYAEAKALREALPAGKTFIVVTSRYHARRSRMIFRRFFEPESVRVSATPYEPFRRQWWRDKDLAAMSILEFVKTFFYLLGGHYS